MAAKNGVSEVMGFFLAIGLLIAIPAALYWVWSRRIDGEIAEGAKIEYDALKKSDPDFMANFDEASFAAVYRRVHFPRFPGHALAAFFAFLLSLPLSFALLSAGLALGRKMGIVPEPVEMAKYIPIGEGSRAESDFCTAECQLHLAQNFGGFLFFFAIIAIWLGIFAFFMHRYHSGRPGYLRDELIRSLK